VFLGIENCGMNSCKEKERLRESAVLKLLQPSAVGVYAADWTNESEDRVLQDGLLW
jgi:hypothetical protein